MPGDDGLVDWSRQGLEQAGFVGFVRFGELPDADVPQVEGVYVVLRGGEGDDPKFRDESPAGWFKGRNPTVSRSQLEAEWVGGAEVLYIGKASVRSSKRGLRRRLDEYRRHGAGNPIGHWGGRLLWQLDHSEELLIAWRPSPADVSAVAEERMLLEQFWTTYGQLPFANLRR